MAWACPYCKKVFRGRKAAAQCHKHKGSCKKNPSNTKENKGTDKTVHILKNPGKRK